MKVTDIKSPKDIKNLSIKQLNVLSEDIRSFIIDSVSKTGGHLSSNLGVVELTIALHYVFDAPKDKIIFDVGHQTYTHKILTGRSNQFSSLRQYNGLSGFQNKKESEYDCWEAGHSSTSLSAGLGMAIQRDVLKQDYNVVTVIGDGSLANGISSEALNNISEYKGKLIIVLNDNEMSISKNTGGINNLLTKLRISNGYIAFKTFVKSLKGDNKLKNNIAKALYFIRDQLKSIFVKDNYFLNMNIDYIGPIDGHNIKELINAFNAAKSKTKGATVVHVITKKGKGFCENDINGDWHGVGKFDIKTKEIFNKDQITYSDIVANKLEEFVKKDDKTFVITPAMANGSKLLNISKNYPNQFIDVGINEEHGAILAASLANDHIIKPYYVIYSTFAQRCYDQINHDIARMDLPVKILLDRSGLVGADGPTHHGIFDISIFSSLPNVCICQGSSKREIEQLLDFSYTYDHPFILRYPRGAVEESNLPIREVKLGKWDYFLTNENIDFVVVSYGNDVNDVYQRCVKEKLNGMIINARFIKPLDTQLLDVILRLNRPFFVYTADMLNNGLGQQILSYANSQNIKLNIKNYGIDDNYVGIGDTLSLRKDNNCDIDTLIRDIKYEIR